MATNRRVLKMDGGRVVRELYNRGIDGNNVGRVSPTNTATCCVCCPPISIACRDTHLWTETSCGMYDSVSDGCYPFRAKGMLVTISGVTMGTNGCTTSLCATPTVDYGGANHCRPTPHPVGCWRWCSSSNSFSGTFILRPGTPGTTDECEYVYRDSSYSGISIAYGCCGEGGAAQSMTLEVTGRCGGVAARLVNSTTPGGDITLYGSLTGSCCCSQSASGSRHDSDCGWHGGTHTIEPYCD